MKQKNFLCFVLVLSIVFLNITPLKTNSYALSNVNKIKLSKISDEEIIYTYEENGKTFKNIETISKDMTEVNTKTFIKKDGAYIPYDTLKTNVDVSKSSATIYSKKLNATEIMDIPMMNRTSDGYVWTYETSRYGNTHVRNVTVAVVSVIIANTVASMVGEAYPSAIFAATTFADIATIIVGMNLNKIYLIDHQFADRSNRLRPKFKDRIVFYKYDNYTGQIGEKTIYYLADM